MGIKSDLVHSHEAKKQSLFGGRQSYPHRRLERKIRRGFKGACREKRRFLNAFGRKQVFERKGR